MSLPPFFGEVKISLFKAIDCYYLSN